MQTPVLGLGMAGAGPWPPRPLLAADLHDVIQPARYSREGTSRTPQLKRAARGTAQAPPKSTLSPQGASCAPGL